MAEGVSLRRRAAGVLIGLALLAAGAAAFFVLVRTAPRPEARPPEPSLPLVRVASLEPSDLRVTVTSYGTVTPRTETLLAAEVAGRIVEIAPTLAGGGSFRAGEVLVRLERRDYELARTRARAALAQARMKLALERASARVAEEEWKLYGKGEPDPLVLRRPQVAEAEAAVAASEAALEQAERDLARTEVAAPYDGRVREKLADVGRYVLPGTALARVYADDVAEVRLPVSLEEAGLLDLPASFGAPGPPVVLRHRLHGERREWTGRIVRAEAELDPRTRMMHLVARVDRPRGADGNGPPLIPGLFVEAEIEGKVVSRAYEVPRFALREGNRLIVVDRDSRVRLRPVEVVRAGVRTAILRGGLEPGDRVCLSPLDVPVDGMTVRTVEEGR
jgi:RND family efflux transporter MFP subunit